MALDRLARTPRSAEVWGSIPGPDLPVWSLDNRMDGQISVKEMCHFKKIRFFKTEAAVPGRVKLKPEVNISIKFLLEQVTFKSTT